MEYVYTALLLHAAGKEINEENVKKVLEAADIKVDDAKVKALVASLDGVDIEEAISKAAVTAAAPAPAPAGEAPKEEKKEEKKEEEKGKTEEEAAAGLGALFG
ncbi:MAG: 50S ribosomal protein P1 [Candidatus Diapherotrites archaeon]|nr:50S ribosomal protein P1 [Candidatus Diapherotrites archaeon]